MNVIYAECHNQVHYAMCHNAECHCAKCHYAECHYAECRYAECHYIERRGAFRTFQLCNKAQFSI